MSAFDGARQALADCIVALGGPIHTRIEPYLLTREVIGAVWIISSTIVPLSLFIVIFIMASGSPQYPAILAMVSFLAAWYAILAVPTYIVLWCPLLDAWAKARVLKEEYAEFKRLSTAQRENYQAAAAKYATWLVAMRELELQRCRQKEAEEQEAAEHYQKVRAKLPALYV